MQYYSFAIKDALSTGIYFLIITKIIFFTHFVKNNGGKKQYIVSLRIWRCSIVSALGFSGAFRLWEVSAKLDHNCEWDHHFDDRSFCSHQFQPWSLCRVFARAVCVTALKRFCQPLTPSQDSHLNVTPYGGVEKALWKWIKTDLPLMHLCLFFLMDLCYYHFTAESEP